MTSAALTLDQRGLKNRVSLKQTISNSLVMARRGLLRVRRNPEQLFDVVIQPICSR